MKIITLTLNPAFDVHCYSNDFRPYHESIFDITSKDAGGKGVNISRALVSNNVENVAVVIVGRENGEEFCKALERDGLRVLPVWTDGRIRENITLHEDKNPETRISFNGFTCKAGILNEVEEKIGEVDGDTVVAFTGSIAKGIATADVLALLGKLKSKGAKVIIDSRSVSLDELVAFKPWLIKPNEDEAEHYTGKKINSVLDAGEIANGIFQSGIENVMVSLGKDGAVLACSEGVFHAETPKIDAVSTIGAGDSTIAGFIDGASLGIEDALKRACAYGTSACMREGTLPPKSEDVANIEKQIKVTKIK
ncbi:MAG: hexose kinase [Clostridia bacterium]|nr:hexose kinase [Clostridia bacterium]